MSTDEHLALVMRELARSLDGVQTVIRQYSGVIEAEREFLTTEQVAGRLKVSDDTVIAAAKRGMPSYSIGKGRTYLWPEVVSWVRQHHGNAEKMEAWTGARRKRSAA